MSSQDLVNFADSIAAIDTLTSKWTASKRSRDAKQESVALGHLEVGATPSVWSRVLTYLSARD